MRQQSTWGRRTFTSVLAVGVAAGVTLSGSLPAVAAPGTDAVLAAENPATPKEAPSDTLGAHDAELLAEAEAAKKKFVTVIVAAELGKSADVAAKIKALGGVVTRRFDQIGYVLASVPIAKVLAASKLAGVSAVDLEETIKLPETGIARENAAKAAALDAPGPTTPAANPYMPTDETGSVDFKKKNPKYDGRGITIGIMDSGVDIDHPALAKTTTGERKIVDWVTATDPLLEGDGSWRGMLTTVTGPTFTFAGGTWKAPEGTWRINRFSESITANSDAAGDVNRDGDTTDTWGILYDPVSHDIRVDTNQNLDFTDDAVMRPYKEKYDIGHFGTDNAATQVVERMPFVVEYREDVDLTPAGLPGQLADFVNIGIPESLHASHVAGIAAGNDLFGNAAFDGQAPGAKIVSSRACSWGGGCTNVALTTGMADLVINRGVDVINMSIGGLPSLNDGTNAQATLYNELITKYGVQMFISAGNSGPGVNTIGEPSGATAVVSVAASISDDTWLSNYGSATRKPLQLFPFSSRGPREDGGFKPNISAPGSAVSLSPTWEVIPGLATVPYTLPAGYSMQNGTSMASPQAAGGAALLLSAAKANGIKVSPASLRRAIYSTADSISGEDVNEQGYGQLNVPDAWKLLAKKSPVRDYKATAPVCTPLDDLLTPTPGQGAGIYNRCAASDGGFKPGQVKIQTIKLTRTSGPSYPVIHTLSWIGDRSSFISSPIVVLPLNKTVSVPVVVRASKDGLASAILKVDDPTTPVIDFEVLNTIVSGIDTKKPSYATSFSGQVDRASTTSYYVTVPEGTKALQVDLSGIAAGSQTRWLAINPWGVPAEDTASSVCFTNYSDAAVCKPDERAYENPIPGVWELEVEGRRTSPVLSNPFKLDAKIQGVSLTPEAITLPSVTVNQPAPVSWTVKNDFGPVTVTPQGGALGSADKQRPTIEDGASQEYEFAVPAGSTRLDVAIGNPADATADLDLSLYRDGVLVGQDADGDSEESISLVNPAAGTYLAVVDGYSVPAGTTAYDYFDVYYSPALGSVTVPNTPVTLANGATTTITGSVTAAAAPPAGRTLSGEVAIVTNEGAIVGRGPINITAVTG